MPADPTILAPVASGDVVSAEDIRDRFQELENFVNGGIKQSDLKVGPSFTDEEKQIFTTRHIQKPEFYSIANTRVQGVSADIFYRNRFLSSFNRYVRHEITGSYNTGSDGFSESDLNALSHEAWTPIDGMSTTVVVKGTSNVSAFVNGSLYAWAGGGSDGIGTKLKERYSDSGAGGGAIPNDVQRSASRRITQCGKYIAVFVLYVDNLDGSGPQRQDSTHRRLYNRGERSYPFRKTQISFADRVTLTPGPNKISYRCIYRMVADNSIAFKHVFIDNRNFFVDVHYK